MHVIALNTFMDAVRKNAARVKQYELGADGSGGGCDCIGLIIGALRLTGEAWPWTHGSNYTARNRMRWMLPLERMGQLREGQLVYKAHEKGAAGWKLPAKYSGHADQRDYYHVGVVTQVDPVVITNCTGVPGGIQQDKTLDSGEWNWYGEIDMVAYGEEGETVAQTMYVVSDNGGPVFLRMSPNRDSGWYDRLDVGTPVEVTDWTGDADWRRVRRDNQYGYMMAQYLKDKPPDAGAETPQEGGGVVVLTLERDAAKRLMTALQEALK